MASSAQPRLLTVEEFLQIDFGPDLKAELDNGVVRMMAGGTRAHDRLQINLIVALGRRLEGTDCRPSGSDMGVRVHDNSLRYPDVSVTCGRDGEEDDKVRTIDDPKVIIEVLSPSTEDHDRKVKLDEYKATASVATIAYINPDLQRMDVWQRTGRDPDSWSEVVHTRPADLELPSLGLIIPHAEIYRRR